MELSGKTAIVTGAGSGIGRAAALRLAREGVSVVVADMNDAGARETVSMVEAAGGRAAAARADVTKPADIDAMFGFAEKTYGGFDILYNNAGVGTGPPRWPDCSYDQMLRTMQVDIVAVLEGTRQAIPRLRVRGGGVIISTASLAGVFGFQADPVYTAAKHGVVGMTRALIGLKDEANIRVNCVCPAVVDTPMVRGGVQNLTGAAREEAERRLSAMPMLAPEEIAEAVYELIRDDDATGVVMGITIGDPRRVIEPPITLPVTSGDMAAGRQQPRG